LIVDEIQTGFARTGKVFAHEHAGIEADLVTMAKSLAGGFPLSAVSGKAEIMNKVHAGGVGGTYGGNPLSCAAALAVIDVIEEEDLCAKAAEMGDHLVKRLDGMQVQFEPIGDVRGLGAMVAMELVTDRATKNPDPDLAKALTQKAVEKGLILISCGVYGNVIRYLVPLTAPSHIIDEGLDIVESSLAELL